MIRLILDTETSGLSSLKHKTLTVGMVAADIEENYLDILGESHIFIKHDEYNANPFALRVNKINLEEHHKIGITPKKACENINTFIKTNKLLKTPLVGHNIPFDMNFIKALFQQGKTSCKLHYELEDTRNMWKRLQYLQKVPTDSRARLKDLANHFQIDYSKAHDALADCHITAKVYQKMLQL